MITLVAVCLFCIINLSAADQRQKIIDFHKDCMSSYSMTEEMLHALLDDGTLKEDNEFYYHFFCAAKQAKIMNDEGVVNLDNFEKDMAHVINPENMPRVVAILKKCVVQKDTILNTIKNGVNCFANEEHNL